MTQEDTDKPKPLFRILWEDVHIYAYFPLLLGRILATSGSIVISNEKLEYSLGMFLAGATFLLLLRVIRKSLLPSVERNFRWYFSLFPITIPCTILWILAWIKGLISLIEVFGILIL